MSRDDYRLLEPAVRGFDAAQEMRALGVEEPTEDDSVALLWTYEFQAVSPLTVMEIMGRKKSRFHLAGYTVEDLGERVPPEEASPSEPAIARPQVIRWMDRRAAIDAAMRKTIMTETRATPRPVRILERGNWQDETGEIVGPNTPSFLPPLNPAGDRPTRLDLARWLTRPDNPLTARVFVNRLWALFFGAGLSERMDDLGAQGRPPSHPALLDWLALHFQSNGWDVKKTIKTLVTSNAYRQASTARPDLKAADPYNRLYGRQSRWRLDAEMVRDTALAISGLLDIRRGGRSVKPYQPAGYWAQLNFPQRKWTADQGGKLYRRTLYTYWCRSFLHPSLLAFDAPSREECAVQRSRSNTPQQALTLLNDPIFAEAARVFGERIAREGGDDGVQWATREALGTAGQRGRSRGSSRCLPVAPEPLSRSSRSRPSLPGERRSGRRGRARSRRPGRMGARSPAPSSTSTKPLRASEPPMSTPLHINRRAFLNAGALSVGATALSTLLSRDLRAASPSPRPGLPGLRPRAKRVIHLCMAGGPSHLETFDEKPELAKMDGKPMPESLTQGQPIAQLQGKELTCLGPQHPFVTQGASGQRISSVFPHIGKIADDICIVRSLFTEQINHDPAHTFMNTGSQISGRPCMGSWVLYGLGAETDSLPGYVVLTSVGGGQNQPIASRQWHAGFLPSRYQGRSFSIQRRARALHSQSQRGQPGQSAQGHRRGQRPERRAQRLGGRSRDRHPRGPI